jgi:hypothetical protein
MSKAEIEIVSAGKAIKITGCAKVGILPQAQNPFCPSD